MNGLELLVRLGIPDQLISSPEIWAMKTSEAAFQQLLETPLCRIVSAANDPASPARLPSIDNSSGILKGTTLLEVVSYRDISKPLPLAKALEATGEEAPPQFTSSRTLKLLLTDGTLDRTFVAMEYESCAQALDQVRLGAKLQLTDAYYHRGILLLTPQCLKFLGAPSQVWSESEMGG